LHLLDILLLESVKRNLVQAEKRLVGVLDKHVLAFLHTQHHVDNGADDTPSVVEVERHLRGELAGLVGENTEDDVVVVVLGVGTRDETEVVLAGIRMRWMTDETYPSFMVSALARIL
jgi:hypothetical protein